MLATGNMYLRFLAEAERFAAEEEGGEVVAFGVDLRGLVGVRAWVLLFFSRWGVGGGV